MLFRSPSPPQVRCPAPGAKLTHHRTTCILRQSLRMLVCPPRGCCSRGAGSRHRRRPPPPRRRPSLRRSDSSDQPKVGLAPRRPRSTQQGTFSPVAPSNRRAHPALHSTGPARNLSLDGTYQAQGGAGRRPQGAPARPPLGVLNEPTSRAVPGPRPRSQRRRDVPVSPPAYGPLGGAADAGARRMSVDRRTVRGPVRGRRWSSC